MQMYPIGMQNFEALRRKDALYVDKTEYIYQLVNGGKYYFLSRPRRFGKSLLLSTMKAFFEGKRELFKGLYIDSCDDIDWTPSPVIYIDLNAKDYSTEDSLHLRLESQLSQYETLYGKAPNDPSFDGRFLYVIQAAYKQTGRQVVVLVDEYEKPILDTIHLKELNESNRNLLAGFYSVIKSADQYLRFCFLTGITRFSHVNIFSGLNNLNDISFVERFEAICGITEDELRQYFQSGFEDFAKKYGKTIEDVAGMLKESYDGYHFSENMTDIYNPFSLLLAFSNRKLGYYWFNTGTPTFLLRILKSKKIELSTLDGRCVNAANFEGTKVSLDDPEILMYQSGYLTIAGYNFETNRYTLGYPNKEVKAGLFSALLPYYTARPESESNFEISNLTDDLARGNIDAAMRRLDSFFADYPYENALDVEVHFQNVIYIIAKLLGLDVNVEYHTSNGRIDMVIKTKEYIYIFEFKRDQKPEVALQQIEEKGYPRPFLSDGRKIIIVGVDFSTTERRISAWQAREAN